MPGIASAATAVVIGYLAGGTSTIRVGAGGVMLPNHSPLVAIPVLATEEVLKRIPVAAPRLAEPPQLTEEPNQIKRGTVSGETRQPQA